MKNNFIPVLNAMSKGYRFEHEDAVFVLCEDGELGIIAIKNGEEIALKIDFSIGTFAKMVSEEDAVLASTWVALNAHKN